MRPLPLLFLIGAFSVEAAADSWGFAAITDNRKKSERGSGTYEGVLEQIRDMKYNPAPEYPKPEFVIAAGDINQSADNSYNWTLWKNTFKSDADKPFYLPVLGNHEANGTEIDLIRNTILASQKDGVNPITKTNVNYHVDWKNVRFIAVDQYSTPFGHSSGCFNEAGSRWIEELIKSAPATIDHVFISFHEPAFPRGHHVGASFDACKSDRDYFWKTIMKHKSMVKAVFVGHTHKYSAIRVADPASSDANNASKFPRDPEGIWQIDAGNAGRGSHSDGQSTVVLVKVDGKDVHFRVVQAPHNSPKAYKLKEEWSLRAATTGLSGSVNRSKGDPEPFRMQLEKRKLSLAWVGGSSDGSVSVLNALGEAVAQSASGPQAKSVLDLKDAPAGTYLLHATWKGMPYFKRFQLQ